ncbi:MAG: hypothetical protein AAGI01_04530, partial [Myxococcota bacterium]
MPHLHGMTRPLWRLMMVMGWALALPQIAGCSSCQPAVLENCINGVDDDGDGQVDCNDTDCAAYPACLQRGEHCFNGIDDDADGSFDC